MTHPEIAKRVAAGAKLLDEKHPGWRAKIKPAMLNMASCKWCVLGQIFDDFGDRRSANVLGVEAHSMAEFRRQAFDHGFGAGLRDDRPPELEESLNYLFALGDEWLRVLATAA